jgi:hypothetical protein
MEHKSEPVAGLIATVRTGIRLRDGYYLNEELVDLYLVGVLRGAAIGLLDAEGPYGRDAARRDLRVEELNQVSAELLDHLKRLRPEPVRTNPAPLPRAPAAGFGPESVSDTLPDTVPAPDLHTPAPAVPDYDTHPVDGAWDTGTAHDPDRHTESPAEVLARYQGAGSS